MGALPSFVYLALALIALAAAGGLLVWVIRYTGHREAGVSEDHTQSPVPADPEPSAAKSAPTGERELLCVRRTEKGEPAIFVRGQCYRQLQEIKDPQVGCETIEALKAVLAFAEGWLPLKQVTPPLVPKKSTVDEEAFLERLRRSNMFFTGGYRSSLSEPLIPVEVINNLVQARLQQRPDLARQRIYLVTESRGNLRIYIGLQSFETVDEIPDPEIRTLIQDAIHEWEST